MRRIRRLLATTLITLSLGLAASPARAGIPVIDVAALAQLIEQVTYWTQQIQHMVTQINQLRDTYNAMTGQRGMGGLLNLSTAARNYLPEDYQQVLDAATGAAGAYAGVSGQVRAIMTANAVLADAALAELTPQQRAVVEDARRAAASLQGLSRTAYGNTSQRFAQLQQLLTAIGATGDQKAILELQGRIQSEQNMLANEQNKLTALYQAAQAQEWARAQQIREHTVQAVGTIRNLPAKAY